MLAARKVSFRRGKRAILDAVDLAVSHGEIVALLGVNGAGKTTLLRCLLHLLKPDGGVVTLDGVPLEQLGRRALARRLAYVPQSHSAPFPFLVRDVVGLGRLPQTGPWAKARPADWEVVEGALAQLGIAHLMARPYTDLSGGERQLTLIARALAQGARILVMDEPVAGLDFGHQLRLLEKLERLAADGYGIIKTTHYPDHALACASRAVLLHQGRIESDGPPAEVLSPDVIKRLFGVTVEMVCSARGRCAFVRA